MITGVLTYSNRITSMFVSRKLDVVGNVELCYLKSVKLKIGNLAGSERKLCRAYVE
jgi:hypothetical protein